MRLTWLICFVFACSQVHAAPTRRKAASKAVALDGSTTSIEATLLLRSPGILHFVVATRGTPRPTAEAIKNARATGSIIHHDKIVAAKAGRRKFQVDALSAGSAYDIFFVTEAEGSNGVFGTVQTISNVNTHAKAPSVNNVAAAVKDASTTSFSLGFALSAAGTAHYVVLAGGAPAPKDGAAVKAAEGAKASGSAEIKAGGKAEPVDVTEGLEAGAAYDVYVVSETPGSNGVFGTVSPKASVTTHAAAPEVKAVEASASDGSTTSFSLSYDLGGSGAQVHYAVLAAGSAAPKDGAAVKAAAGAKAKGSEDVKAGAKAAPVDVSKGLAAGTTYDVYVVSETPGSKGVFSAVSSKASVTTHDTAPNVASLKALAEDGSTVSFSLRVALAGDGDRTAYYMVQTGGSPAPKDGAAVKAASGAKANGAITFDGSDEAALTVSKGLEAGTAYDVYVVSETLDSNGVFGMVAPKTSVTTHASAPSVSFAAAAPTDASTSSVSLSFKVAAPCVLYYALRPLPDPVASAIMGVVLAKPGTLEPPPTVTGNITVAANALSGSHTVDGLNAGTRYEALLMTETPGSQGVYSAPRPGVAVMTHGEAPSFDDFSALATNGTTDSMALDFTTSEAATVHFIVRVAGAPAPSGTDVASAKGTNVAAGTLEMKAGDRRATDRAQKLKPATKYDVYAVCETTASKGVLGQVIAKKGVSTWAASPKLGTPTVAASNGTSSSLRIAYAHRKTPGTKSSVPFDVHFAVIRAGGGDLTANDVVTSVQGAKGVLALGKLESSGDDNFAGVVEPLAPNTEFKLFFVAEVTGSEVFSEAVSASARTHDTAPGLPKLTLGTRAGHADSIDIEYQLDKPGLLHWAAFAAHDSDVEIDSMAPDMIIAGKNAMSHGTVAVNRSALSGSAGITGLEANTAYRAFTVTEAVQSDGAQEKPGSQAAPFVGSGVYGEVKRTKPTTTFPVAPELISCGAVPAAGSASAIDIKYKLKNAGQVHFVVAPNGTSNVAEAAALKAITRVAPAVSVSDGETKAAKGVLQIAGAQTEDAVLRVTGLKAGTTHDVFVASEAAGESGVFGKLCALQVSTHADAPKFVRQNIAAAMDVAGAIDITVETSAQALVHYVVRTAMPAGGATPAQLINGELGGKVAKTGSMRSQRATPDSAANATVRLLDLGEAATFEVALLSETEDSDGVLAQPVQKTVSVTTFSLPAKLSSASVVAKDASTDTLLLRFSADGSTMVHFVVMEKGCGGSGAVAPGAPEIKAANVTDEKGCASAKGTINIAVADAGKQHEEEIAKLASSTDYAVFVVAEVPKANGIFSEVHGPFHASTHAVAPEVDPDVDCSKAPDCASLHRDECWLEPHTCGECVDGYVGEEGAANSNCEPSSPEAKRKAAAKAAAKREAAEKAKREAEEKAKLLEQKAMREAEEKAKREETEKAKREAVEKAKREAEAKAKREAEDKAKREAEDKAKREAEDKAKKREAEDEAADKAKLEAEDQAKREADDKAKREAEDKAKREAEDKAKREVEEKTMREAEEKAMREAEEKTMRDAEEKAMREAEEKAKREAEEKAKREAEEKATREAEAQAQRVAEQAEREAAADAAAEEKKEAPAAPTSIAARIAAAKAAAKAQYEAAAAAAAAGQQ